MNTDMASMTSDDFEQLKKEYIDAIPAGDALKQQLKSHNKEQKTRLNQIHGYMREQYILVYSGMICMIIVILWFIYVS